MKPCFQYCTTSTLDYDRNRMNVRIGPEELLGGSLLLSNTTKSHCNQSAQQWWLTKKPKAVPNRTNLIDCYSLSSLSPFFSSSYYAHFVWPIIMIERSRTGWEPRSVVRLVPNYWFGSRRRVLHLATVWRLLPVKGSIYLNHIFDGLPTLKVDLA